MSTDLANAIDNVLSDEQDVRTATAPFQAEFPYERDEEAQVTRREFCNFLVLTSTTFFLGAAGFSAKAALDASEHSAFSPMPIQGASELPPGSALNFHYPAENDTAILVRAKDGSYAAFGQKCTHLSCPVHYSKQNDRLECPCHEGGFDAKTGEVLYGPPPRPLDKINIENRNGQLIAVGREVRGNES
jgi:arsenite oxidase small subunit